MKNILNKKEKETFKKLADKFVWYYTGNITKASFLDMYAWIERDWK